MVIKEFVGLGLVGMLMTFSNIGKLPIDARTDEVRVVNKGEVSYSDVGRAILAYTAIIGPFAVYGDLRSRHDKKKEGEAKGYGVPKRD